MVVQVVLPRRRLRLRIVALAKSVRGAVTWPIACVLYELGGRKELQRFVSVPIRYLPKIRNRLIRSYRWHRRQGWCKCVYLDISAARHAQAPNLVIDARVE